LSKAEQENTQPFVANAITISLAEPISNLSWIGKSLLFAELSRLSYGEPDEVGPVAYASGLDECEFVADAGAEVYVLGNRHDCVVVARGTEPNKWDDIRADANALTIAIDVGRVHSGFHGHVDILWPKIEQLLRENQRPVWFAGHSLGGAMATLCAVRCRISQIPSEPRAIFTFGSPRVGDRKVVKFLKIRHYRWVNNNDIVARVPPRWMGYRHMGREIYLNRKGRVSSLPTWLRWHDGWRGFLRSLSQWKLDHLSDHSMVEYIGHIRKYYEDEKAGKKTRMPKFRYSD
jgi:triacylglycerol lipase